MADRNTLTDRDRAFIDAQHMFFVATAPRTDDGLVNVSPKGLAGTLKVLDDKTVAYLDLTGSGIETISHVRENGRVCLMFCAFDGPPNILRIHGKGEVVEPNDDQFAGLASNFPELPGVRSVIVIHIGRVASSCGFGVPEYQYVGQRTRLTEYAEKKGPEGIREYQLEKNLRSLDGLPGLKYAT